MIQKIRGRLISYFDSDILSGSQVWGIFFPLLWEQLFFAVVPIVATWMIAGEGETAVSAVSMVNTFNFMFTQVCMSFGMGGTVMVAQYTGAQNPRLAVKSLQQGMSAATAIGLVISLVLLLTGKTIVSFFLAGAPREVLDLAYIYFIGISMSLPFFSLYQGFAGGMRGWGRTKTALYLTLFVNCTEIGLSALFVLILRQGVIGIAAAIILSRALGGVVAVAYIARHKGEMNLVVKDFFQPIWPILRGLIHVAVPVALEQVFFHSGKAFTQRYIAGYGTTHMVANAVATVVTNFGIASNGALSTATLTIVGMAIGRERIDLAREYTRKFVRGASLYNVINILPMIPFTMLMVYLYHVTPEAAKLTYLSAGVFFGFAPLFVARSSMSSSALRAGGDAVYTSTVSLCSMWSVRVLLAYFLTRVLAWGVVGVFAAMALEWGVRGLLFTLRFNGDKWYRHKLIVRE
ncbi:MAG: MATE family efflux transporter [Clostridiales bacterium]|nr:MATE family efflux transporter [Clostridiales bacterium]